MVIDKKETVRNLKRKGFVESSSKSDDHIYLEYIHNGKLILYTKVSHGSSKDIGIPLLKQMAQQCKLSKNDFTNLAKCPLSADAYLQIIDNLGLLI
jgi:predicted RNA binding protein YcfA (HicA-like mRNA interferase family)